MTAYITPQLVFKAFDANGGPLASGQLFTYQSGTNIPLATFTDATGLTEAPNPIILDANGERPLWIGPTPYRFNLLDANGNQMPNYPVDAVSSIPPPNAAQPKYTVQTPYGIGDVVQNNAGNSTYVSLINGNTSDPNAGAFNLTASAASGTLNVTATTQVLGVGTLIAGNGSLSLPAGTVITGLGTGRGGVGTYLINYSGTITSSTYNLNGFNWDLYSQNVSIVITGAVTEAVTTLTTNLGDTSNPAHGAGMVAYKAPYTGAVPRTQAAKNSDMVSVLDFGADPTGATDSTAAIQAAITAASAGCQILFPPGTYKTSSALLFQGNQTWHCAGATINSTSTDDVLRSYNQSVDIFYTRICDLTVVSATALHGINLQSCNNFTLENFNPSIYTTSGIGIYLKNGPGTSQCYFNHLVNCNPSVPSGIGINLSGTAGVSGANSNLIHGGRCWNCAIPLQLDTGSSANTIVMLDMEQAVSAGTAVVLKTGSSSNLFLGIHIEMYTTAINIDATCGSNRFIGPTIVGTISIIDSGSGSIFDYYSGDSNAMDWLKHSWWQIQHQHLPTLDRLMLDFQHASGTGNVKFDLFPNTPTGELPAFRVFSPGTTNIVFGYDPAWSGYPTNFLSGHQIIYNNTAPSGSNAFANGDLCVNTFPTTARAISHWIVVSSWPATWRAVGIGQGTTTDRTGISPALGTNDAGYQFYDTTLAAMKFWNGTAWV